MGERSAERGGEASAPTGGDDAPVGSRGPVEASRAPPEGTAEPNAVGRIQIRRELEEDQRLRRMARDVREGLGSDPKTLPPKYFYDERGSRLFAAITRLPEYYQTRTERSILERNAEKLVLDLRPEALVEYGSGSAGKTEVLLRVMEEEGLLKGYAPIDVSPAPVEAVATRFAREFPTLRVEGIIGDFETPIRLPFRDLPRLVLFLGSTIGNMRSEEGVEFLGRVAREMEPSDAFLVGFDLVKDRETLTSAYNDPSGVTAEFNRNVLRVLNRELEADFDVEAFRHRALWNEAKARIEMHLFATRRQTVRLGRLDLKVEFGEGESVRTELSHKYTRDSAADMLEAAGLGLERWMTDPDDLFALAEARSR